MFGSKRNNGNLEGLSSIIRDLPKLPSNVKLLLAINRTFDSWSTDSGNDHLELGMGWDKFPGIRQLRFDNAGATIALGLQNNKLKLWYIDVHREIPPVEVVLLDNDTVLQKLNEAIAKTQS